MSEKSKKSANKPRGSSRYRTPDVAAEVLGKRQADRQRRHHLKKPSLPSVTEQVELHTPAIVLSYKAHFAAISEYAIAVDEVARIRLDNSDQFKTYLKSFDGYIDHLKRTINNLQGTLESESNGGVTENDRPEHISATIQTNRSMQMLTIFQQADMVLRHSGFLHIYSEDHDHTTIELKTLEAINRCVKGLRKTKKRVFEHIKSEQKLNVKIRDNMTLDELMAQGSAKSSNRKRKVSRGSRTLPPQIDPQAPAAQEVS